MNPPASQTPPLLARSLHRRLFPWLAASHFVMTCGSAFVYAELHRVGALSLMTLAFDAVGCAALYLAAGLAAAGNTRIRGLLFIAFITLAQAAYIRQWIPGWWLVPAFGAFLAAYGLWAFGNRPE